MTTILASLTELSSALSLTLVAAILSCALLRGWNGWLSIKRLELERADPATPADAREDAPAVTARIEMAHLKERIRKLEAIAAGIDI